MGNNNTTASERHDVDNHSTTSSTGGSRLTNDYTRNNLSGGNPSIVSFSFRRTGLLGLGKTELDQRCQPSGLYKSCLWDDRTIRRLIADGKLAARLVGTDNDDSIISKSSEGFSSTAYLHECPICFLQYTQVNVATCCAASICTECYLQVHPPKEKNVTCPFCNNANFDVQVAKQLDEEYVLQREEEEQKVIEATIRSRSGLISVIHRTDPIKKEKDTPEGSIDSITIADSSLDLDRSAHGDEFGSNLVKRLRARSESLSIRDLKHDSIMTISADERRQLELEMKDQKSHPLLRMLDLEAEETCHRHELEHSERVSRNRFLLRGSLGRRLSQPNQNSNSTTQDRNGNQATATISRGGLRDDGLGMLETALLIAMEERSLRDRAINSGLMNIDESDSSYADALALLQELLTRRQQLRERPSTSSRAIQRRLGLEAQLEAATNMLLSILPEEDQIAMAMAMSLGEVNTEQGDIDSTSQQEAILRNGSQSAAMDLNCEISGTGALSEVPATPGTVAEAVSMPTIDPATIVISSTDAFTNTDTSTSSPPSGVREQDDRS